MVISMIATLLKRLGAVCLAFVIFWHVTHASAPRRSRAIVHVSQPGVMVIVDHANYRIRSIAESPVICELEPGDHRAQVWRDGVMVGEEHFTVEPGKDLVLPPFDGRGAETAVAGARPVATADSISPAGLAAHIQLSEPTAAAN